MQNQDPQSDQPAQQLTRPADSAAEGVCMTVPKVGDIIYVYSECYVSHGANDFEQEDVQALTGSGRNSLSSRSVQLVKGLSEDVRITAVFAEPDKRDTLGLKRQRQIRDLLDLYQARPAGEGDLPFVVFYFFRAFGEENMILAVLPEKGDENGRPL
jgi:hypothetical protein